MSRKPAHAAVALVVDERETPPEAPGPVTIMVVSPHERRRRIIEDLLMRRRRPLATVRRRAVDG